MCLSTHLSCLVDLGANMIGRSNARRGARRLFAVLQNRRLNQHLLYTIVDEVRRLCFSRVSWNLAKVVCATSTGLRGSLLRHELMIYCLQLDCSSDTRQDRQIPMFNLSHHLYRKRRLCAATRTETSLVVILHGESCWTSTGDEGDWILLIPSLLSVYVLYVYTRLVLCP